MQQSDVPEVTPRTRPSDRPGEPAPEAPVRVADRYLVEELLGKGGMAAVYRVRDTHGGAAVALKQLLPIAEPKRRQNIEHAFEREFHTLAQLSHPRVIAVYDYGVDRAGAYYTMELLDGGDLRERAPMPWREACARAFDVCSSLALLHSRGLIHRDISPRNVRCTRDGTAKLIDFGALSAFGAGQAIVGTPAFIAPEVVRRGTLDGRSDLFSLGATLYHALTGRSPYPAREFAQLIESWSRKPLPISGLVPDVPNALEALVAALVSLEPESRPRTAFEVMERLSAIAELGHDEPLSVQQAYLQTPMLVGRDDATTSARLRIERALAGSGGGLVIRGGAGIGRSRMLDACILEAKTLGASVLYARAEASGGEPLALAQQLCEQLLELHPSAAHASAIERDASQLFCTDDAGEPRVVELARAKLPRTELQSALVRWLADVARVHPLLIAVDNLERVDEPSAALLARLGSEMRRQALLVVATVLSGPADERSPAIAVLEDSGRSLDLLPLTHSETDQLLGSVFGDVPNLGFVSAWIDSVARGNPRACMDLAQHLVDLQQVSYRGGRWSLPGSLDGVALPASTEEVLRERLRALSPL
ncbi:MAG TPA: serine/threonine-protein kinase, partial [Polyangiales bacterium]|nr:serine/threonine-protein kinase [Polyangiales bacterium]